MGSRASFAYFCNIDLLGWYCDLDFQILGRIESTETFATGSRIREIRRPRRVYGPGRWRKRKGIATVILRNGTIRVAEVHWYEAAGVGRREYKVKHFLD